MADAIRDEDFTRPDGTIDWAAASKARRANGETCSKCRSFITCWNPPGHEQICYSCRDLRDDADEVTHDDFIRCPKCGHEEDTGELDCDSGYIFSDGDHDWACSECGHVFLISTDVSYSFTSPARIKEGG